VQKLHLSSLPLQLRNSRCIAICAASEQQTPTTQRNFEMRIVEMTTAGLIALAQTLVVAVVLI
jgi:hypothetical protein